MLAKKSKYRDLFIQEVMEIVLHLNMNQDERKQNVLSDRIVSSPWGNTLTCTG
jgi:hypothetical protein